MVTHRQEFRLTSMCRIFRVQRSGYYAWVHKPQSTRAQADAVLLGDIKQFFEASTGIYGSPRIHRDLREAGTRCGEKRCATDASSGAALGTRLQTSALPCRQARNDRAQSIRAAVHHCSSSVPGSKTHRRQHKEVSLS